jgi:hypothetical protein
MSFRLTIYTIGLSSAGDLFNLIVITVTSIAAGFIYWRIAGRSAGVWRGITTRGTDNTDTWRHPNEPTFRPPSLALLSTTRNALMAVVSVPTD